MKDSNPKKLAGTATTTIGACLLYGICINKTLVGTLTVQEGATAVGAFAVGTAPGTYHMLPNGGRYANLQLVLSGADDVTVYTGVF